MKRTTTKLISCRKKKKKLGKKSFRYYNCIIVKRSTNKINCSNKLNTENQK